MKMLAFALYTVTANEFKATNNLDWLALLKWEKTSTCPMIDYAQVGVSLPYGRFIDN